MISTGEKTNVGDLYGHNVGNENVLAGPFRSFARPGGLRGPDAKNHSYHQPIEIKFCLSHYSHKSIPDAKFESGSFTSFEDMTSQNFSLKMGTSHQIRIFKPGKWV